jgi:HEPN domain-containing protein
MPSRARDWFAQAERDLEHAVRSVEARHYEWACFAAQQASEKGLKAVYQSLGGDARGHDLDGLLQGLAERLMVPPDLAERATELGKHYIATRYPNAHAAGPPARHYTQGEAQRAIEHAQEILRFCGSHLA